MVIAGSDRRPTRKWWFRLYQLSPFVRWFTIGSALAFLAGGVWGFVRGLDYLPTLPVAIIEGGFIIGVPGSIVATMVAGIIWAIERVHRPES